VAAAARDRAGGRGVRGPPHRSAAALAALIVLAGAAGALAAESAGGGTGADSTDSTGSAAADSSAAHRTLISTDGAVQVYEELQPGEGIEGFWWEYDAQSDLERLLDDDRRDERLDPITDTFGFDLAIPDTIRALRDSVIAVADSILAERIEVDVVFDPKLTSTYNETKDVYTLKNQLDTAYPLARRGNVTVAVTNSNEFNESTGKIKDDRSVNTAFNYKYSEAIVSTLSLNWNKGLQERDNVTESKSDAVSVSSGIRNTRDVGLLGELETKVGMAYNQRDYESATTVGHAGELKPDWKVRLARSFPGGSSTLDYTGNRGTSRREETRTQVVVDSTGATSLVEMLDESDETNSSNRVSLGANYKPGVAKTDIQFQSKLSRDRFQYLSQVDSLQGRQETRSREAESAALTVKSTPHPNLDVTAKGEIDGGKTAYALENGRTTRTLDRSGNLEATARPWGGARWIFKLRGSAERRDYRTAQTGDVKKRQGSIDFRQEVTEHVDFEGAFFVSLDRFEFDDTDANPNDRDLRTRRGTFTVRYNPFSALTSSVRMELRQFESIYVNRLKSGDNNTDHGFLITPQYSWKIGSANLSGDFTADARYKVQDFKNDSNTLNRTFTVRQKWQQQFTERLSTEVQYRWDFNDQGSYNRSEADGKRRFARALETRRSTLETKIRYQVLPGLLTGVEYRKDEDSQYDVRAGAHELRRELPRRQFLYRVEIKRKILPHVSLDVRFSQTLKGGPNLSEVQRDYYNIRAQLQYEPFKKRDDPS
jgi:hypothetical protein